MEVTQRTNARSAFAFPTELRDRGTSLAESTPVPFLDVHRENRLVAASIQTSLARVMESERFILGSLGEELEAEIARRSGARHGIACASGSDALLLSLMALDIRAGDEVILPSFTFFATASAITRLGATPVFADLEPDTFHLDPSAVEAAVTPATRAILPVHLYGQIAAMREMQAIAARHGLSVVEDAAQAIGAELDGCGAGSIGTTGAFSFYPTKNLGGMGDGGLITTSVDALADRLQLLRAHGMRPRYHHQCVGINSRLDEFQAAVLLAKLPHLDGWLARRREVAALYDELFDAWHIRDKVGLPPTRKGCVHTWHQYTIRVREGKRDALRDHLQRRGIGTEVYYPIPLHRQPCFANLGYREGSLPESERAAAEVLSLPIYPGLREDEQQSVVRGIAEFYTG